MVVIFVFNNNGESKFLKNFNSWDSLNMHFLFTWESTFLYFLWLFVIGIVKWINKILIFDESVKEVTIAVVCALLIPALDRSRRLQSIFVLSGFVPHLAHFHNQLPYLFSTMMPERSFRERASSCLKLLRSATLPRV